MCRFARCAVSFLLFGIAAPSWSGVTGTDLIFADGFESGDELRWLCVNLECWQLDCPGPGETSVSGTIFAPNGTTPLPNVTVYVPNAAVPALPDGAQCSRCDDPLPGSPLVLTTTAADGTFTLANMPAGNLVPLVVQSGKWRRQVLIEEVFACSDAALDPEATRLPKNQAEGDLPRIAVSTGSADAYECLLRKVGISDEEFTTEAGSGRVNLYAGTGTDQFDSSLGGAAFSVSNPTLWGSQTTLGNYDVVALACESSQNSASKPPAALSAMKAYADAGGRVLASHWHNYWLQAGPSPWPTVVTWNLVLADLGPLAWVVNLALDRGAEFGDWLVEVGATMNPASINFGGADHSATAVAGASRWISRDTTPNGSASVQMLSFTTPVEAPAAERCGRVTFTEFHASETGDSSDPALQFPSGGCVSGNVLSAKENVLLYALFDVGTCSGPFID